MSSAQEFLYPSRTRFHEAGHALTAFLLNVEPLSANIDTREDYGAHVTIAAGAPPLLQIRLGLAGVCAEAFNPKAAPSSLAGGNDGARVARCALELAHGDVATAGAIVERETRFVMELLRQHERALGLLAQSFGAAKTLGALTLRVTIEEALRTAAKEKRRA